MKKEIDTNDNRNKKSIIGTIFKILLIIIIIAILVFGGWIAINYLRHKSTDADYDPLSAAALGVDPEKMKNVGRLNVLILGESGVGDGYKLTDSIMIVSYNPQTQQASMLSIPRDTYIGKRDKNSATQNYLMSYKMNAAYRNGENIQETVERVSDITGVKIDNYVLVDTDAIQQIVNAIGGVTFNVPIDMDYDDDTQDLYIHLKAGEQLIDGAKAEQLLRFRHNNDGSSYPMEYGDNDLGRMKTQREFIKETMKQLIKFENVTKVVNLLDIVYKNVKTDLEMDTIKCYIPYIFHFNMENIKSDMVPGVSEKCNGVYIYVPNKKETEQVVANLFTDISIEEQQTMEQTNTIDETTNTVEETANVKSNKEIKIEILNGTGSDEKLENAKTKLTKEGYTITKTGNTSSTANSLIINRTMKSKTIVEELKDVIGINNVNNSSSNSKVDFTIILGKDYK